MSRLHDIKKGITNLPGKIANKALDGTMRYALPKMKAFENEDPEKVKAFLKELSEDTTFPKTARDSARKLLEGYTKGHAPLHEVMNEHLEETVKNLSENNKS